MASLSGSKRPHSPPNPSDDKAEALFVPQEDLTAENFGTRDDLTDRQWFAWAYRTETKVRFQKLQTRSTGDETTTYSKTLDSEYLIDIYPDTTSKVPSKKAKNKESKFQSLLERDQLLFQRKALESMRDVREPDGSLSPLQITGYDYDREFMFYISSDNNKAVPPNYLYFLIVLEAYCGYDLMGLYNSNDPSVPRGAMMGGAVVAALTSWRDSLIRLKFEDLEDFLAGEKTDKTWKEQYIERKQEIILSLNDYFTSELGSPFAPGDVDVFLQASPLTHSLHTALVDVNPDIPGNISNFIGGIGLCHSDLDRFASEALGRLDEKFSEDGKFVYALAKNGISTMFAPYDDLSDDEDYSDDEDSGLDSDGNSLSSMQYEMRKYNRRFETKEVKDIWEKRIWPRCTQLIMLNPQADLLGAVMDFDLSLTSCTFDGTSVRVTPRAALSLQRKLVVVTPFCFEERRNRKRIVKYFKRGFDTAIIDPNCLHPTECSNCEARIEKQSSPRLDELELLKAGTYKSKELRGEMGYQDILRKQDEDIRNGGQFIGCCHSIGEGKGLYSMALFEQSEGHATEFFANEYHWSEEMIAEVKAVPNSLRTACKPCRRKYGLTLFLAEESPVVTLDDVLRGKKAFKYSYGHSGFFHPSFYSGGVFDSKRVKNDARTLHVAYSALLGQAKAERARYILAHGNSDGYLKRFVIPSRTVCEEGRTREKMTVFFREASRNNLSCSGRPPVGLNPERFIAQCQDCSEWLHGYEFGSELCEQCSNKKPPAN